MARHPSFLGKCVQKGRKSLVFKFPSPFVHKSSWTASAFLSDANVSISFHLYMCKWPLLTLENWSLHIFTFNAFITLSALCTCALLFKNCANIKSYHTHASSLYTIFQETHGLYFLIRACTAQTCLQGSAYKCTKNGWRTCILLNTVFKNMDWMYCCY